MSDKLCDFVIAGAPRCGTTSLARYLESHPSVFMAPGKEIHFFDDHFDRGVDWYVSHFEDALPDQIRGEATPGYMSSSIATSRMQQLIPQARILLSFRNPVDRIWSHYWMRRERGLESREFTEVLRYELDVAYDEGADSNRLFYIKHSLYAHHLKRLLRAYPPDQIHIVIFERMAKDPEPVYAAACRFLDIDDSYHPPNLGDPVNRYIRVRSIRIRNLLRDRSKSKMTRIVARLNTKTDVFYQDMEMKVRHRLETFFSGHNRQLEEILGDRIFEWSDDISPPPGIR